MTSRIFWEIACKSSHFWSFLGYVGEFWGLGRDKRNVFLVVLDSGGVGFGDCGGLNLAGIDSFNLFDLINLFNLTPVGPG